MAGKNSKKLDFYACFLILLLNLLYKYARIKTNVEGNHGKLDEKIIRDYTC